MLQLYNNQASAPPHLQHVVVSVAVYIVTLAVQRPVLLLPQHPGEQVRPRDSFSYSRGVLAPGRCLEWSLWLEEKASRLVTYTRTIQERLLKRKLCTFTVVQQQARLILGRLQLLGDGTTEAARRRERAVLAEATAVRERRAQAVCLRQGRDIRRHGFGLLG